MFHFWNIDEKWNDWFALRKGVKNMCGEVTFLVKLLVNDLQLCEIVTWFLYN